MDTSQVDQTLKYVTALGPAFAAGFAVQQFVEIIDSVVVWSGAWDPSKDGTVTKKKAALSLISLAIAAAVVLFDPDHFNVIKAIGVLGDKGVSIVISIAFISAGTEGFNSLLKWLTYKKEDAKATAAQNKGTAQGSTPAADSSRGSLHLMPS